MPNCSENCPILRNVCKDQHIQLPFTIFHRAPLMHLHLSKLGLAMKTQIQMQIQTQIQLQMSVKVNACLFECQPNVSVRLFVRMSWIMFACKVHVHVHIRVSSSISIILHCRHCHTVVTGTSLTSSNSFLTFFLKHFSGLSLRKVQNSTNYLFTELCPNIYAFSKTKRMVSSKIQARLSEKKQEKSLA